MSNTKLQKQIINMYSNMYSLFDLNSFIPKTGTLRTCDSSQRSGGIRFVEDSWCDGHGFRGLSRCPTGTYRCHPSIGRGSRVPEM